MKIYRLQATGRDPDGDIDNYSIWFTRKSDEPSTRRKLLSLNRTERDFFDWQVGALEVHEVPTDKKGLVDFLNENCWGQG